MRTVGMRGVAETTVVALNHMALSGYACVHSFLRRQWTHLSCNGFNPVQPYQTDAAAASRPEVPSTRPSR